MIRPIQPSARAAVTALNTVGKETLPAGVSEAVTRVLTGRKIRCSENTEGGETMSSDLKPHLVPEIVDSDGMVGIRVPALERGQLMDGNAAGEMARHLLRLSIRLRTARENALADADNLDLKGIHPEQATEERKEFIYQAMRRRLGFNEASTR